VLEVSPCSLAGGVQGIHWTLEGIQLQIWCCCVLFSLRNVSCRIPKVVEVSVREGGERIAGLGKEGELGVRRSSHVGGMMGVVREV
jgi:hypothetical protein